MLCALAYLGVTGSAAGAKDARPDFSGVWTTYIEPGKTFMSSFSMPKLSYTPDGEAKVKAFRALVGPTDNPSAHCLGAGMPLSMYGSGGYPMEIIQRPEQITVIYEAHNETRRLYIGDKIIPPGDRIHARNGYSTARWEGNTLVVETGSLKEQEEGFFPHSEQAQIVERYHQEIDKHGTRVLIADWTITDPVFYTQPFTAQKKWAFDPKGILLPYECDEDVWLQHLEDLRSGKESIKNY